MDNSLYVQPSYREQSKADHVGEVEANLISMDMAQRMYNSKLTALRCQNQGLEIALMTNKALAVRLVPGTAVDIDLPSGTKMVRFNSDGFFLVTRNGRAQLPADGVVERDAGAFYPNSNTYYYVEENRQLSIISDMQVRVSIECIAQM